MSKGNSTKPRPYAARVDWSQNESLSLVCLYLFVAASDNQARKHAVSGDISKRLRSQPGRLRWSQLYDPTNLSPLPSSIPRVLCGRCRSSPISVHPSANFATVMTEWLTAAEAAAHLKVRPRTLLLWVRQGRVPAHRLSGVRRCVWRFLRSELDAMLTPSSAGAAQEEAC